MSKILIPYEQCHKLINNVQHKLCNICGEWMPATEEYFYKNVKNIKDGIHLYCKKCAIEKSKNRRVNNKEYDDLYHKEWRKREEVKKRQRNHFARWKEDNLHQIKEYFKQYQINNPDKLRQYRITNQIKRHKISKAEWEECKKYFNYSCAYCGLSIDKHFYVYGGKLKQGDLHKEHVIHNGSDTIENCVPSCKNCNSKKHDKDFSDWYNSNNEYYSETRYNKINEWINSKK